MNQLIVHTDRGEATISRHIHGHFAEHLGRCIYEGFWVGEDSPIPNTRGIRNDVVAALRRLKLPNLRWPGGCFADEYHWMDGIGPRAGRPSIVNTHWGGVTENNHFGTHEFFDLCMMLDAAPYICGNVGSGRVQEMQQWVEYCTFPAGSPMADLRRANGREAPWKLPFFGVGNENWGCGGNMRPAYYADEYRRYGTYVRNLGGNTVFKIACGANGRYDYDWTEELMRNAGRHMDGLSLHFYTSPGAWGEKGSATAFSEDDWFATLQCCLKMEELVVGHGAIMDKHDAEKRVALIVDEWGTWWDVEPDTNPGFLHQQNTLRDALVAGVTLNIFHRHCDRVRMANIAQTVNVLQAMILTDGPRMLCTPTYHVFEMNKVHQDAMLLPSDLECGNAKNGIPLLSASASRDANGTIHLTLCNLHPTENAMLKCELSGADSVGSISGRILTAPAMNAHNTFDDPEAVVPAPFAGFARVAGGIEINLPAKSVVVLAIDLAK